MDTLKEYATLEEQAIVDKIMEYATNNDWRVSVYDSEEYACKRLSPNAAKAFLATTEADTLIFRDHTGEAVGFMLLIWGNGEDLISDHTDNKAMNTLAAFAE